MSIEYPHCQTGKTCSPRRMTVGTLNVIESEILEEILIFMHKTNLLQQCLVQMQLTISIDLLLRTSFCRWTEFIKGWGVFGLIVLYRQPFSLTILLYLEAIWKSLAVISLHAKRLYESILHSWSNHGAIGKQYRLHTSKGLPAGINRRMAELVLEGHRILNLKSTDYFLSPSENHTTLENAWSAI